MIIPTPVSSPPVAIIGSDDLVSPLWRVQHNDQASYRFQIGRIESPGGRLCFAHYELRSLVKLSQVLAFAICDDGWLKEEEQQPIDELYHQLDAITVRWNR